MTHAGGNPQQHTRPVKTLWDEEKERILSELEQISKAHKVKYTLARRNGEYGIYLGPFKSGRVDIVRRSNHRAFLVVSGIEWMPEVEPIS
jgi:hypothetical protein